MNKHFIKKHIVLVSLFITSLLTTIIYFIKPNIMFNRDGSLKEFGLGNNSKTVVPLWYVVLILAILVYCAVRFHLISHRI